MIDANRIRLHLCPIDGPVYDGHHEEREGAEGIGDEGDGVDEAEVIVIDAKLRH